MESGSIEDWWIWRPFPWRAYFCVGTYFAAICGGAIKYKYGIDSHFFFFINDSFFLSLLFKSQRALPHGGGRQRQHPHC